MVIGGEDRVHQGCIFRIPRGGTLQHRRCPCCPCCLDRITNIHADTYPTDANPSDDPSASLCVGALPLMTMEILSCLVG